MKKIISIILVLAMAMSMVSLTAFAGDGLEKLTLSVKERAEIPEEYTKLSTSRFSSDEGEVLRLCWENEDGESISVEVRSDGIITSYSDSRVSPANGISAFSQEEACKIANDFMKKLNPAAADEYIFDKKDVTMGYGIRISADRYIDGIRVEGDYAYISMDSKTGEISHMSMEYTDANLPKPENIITEEQARDGFTAASEIILAYVCRDGGAAPVYADIEEKYGDDFGIDAFTGEIVKITDKYVIFNRATAEDSAGSVKQMNSPAILTEAELEELAKYDECISKEDSLSIIRNIKELGMSGCEAERISYVKRYVYKDDEQTEDGININLVVKDSKTDRRAYAVLDGKTGNISGYNVYSGSEETEAVITDEKADKTADAFAAKVIKDKKYAKVYSGNSGYGNQRTVKYCEEVNGIPCLDSGAEVSVNTVTGYVERYYTFFDEEDIKFSEAGETIGKEAAADAYAQSRKYELVYVNMADYDEKPEYKLLYLKSFTPECIDALSGNPVYTDGSEYTEEKTEFTDISGHWAEYAIQALIDNNYLCVDGDKFRPDDEITAKEAQEIMWGAGIYSSEIENTDNVLSREEIVKQLVCGAGYEKVGALTGIYAPVFADWGAITPGNCGYVAIAKGLGIISGDNNGNFNPHKTVTRGEFAVMIYNYIEKGNMRW